MGENKLISYSYIAITKDFTQTKVDPQAQDRPSGDTLHWPDFSLDRYGYIAELALARKIGQVNRKIGPKSTLLDL